MGGRLIIPGHPIHLSDDEAAELGFWYDEAAAARAVEFFPRYLRHGKGEWAGKPFWLLPWQEDEVIRPLFGWQRLGPDGERLSIRRFREGGVWVPKKNGKTPLGAGILIYCMIADGEFSAECYSAATTRGQAGLIYNDAVKMIKLSPKLKGRLKIIDSTKTITQEKTFSRYQVLSGEATSAEGLNASCVCFDELHAQKNRRLYDALIYGGASRRQPIFLTLSTAGEYDPNSIGWVQFEHARAVLDGSRKDPTFFAYVAAADPGDDWRDPAVWAKANPSLGVTISETVFAEEVERALSSPSKQASFKRYRLNMWTQSVDAWVNAVDWNKCRDDYSVNEDALVGRECYGAFDLSRRKDLTAWGLYFPGITAADAGEDGDMLIVPADMGGIWLPRFWIPEDTLRERDQQDKLAWGRWVDDGQLLMTQGNVVDYNQVAEVIMADCEKYKPRLVGYDVWNATNTAQIIQDAGVEAVEVPMNYQHLGAPCKELELMIASHRLAMARNEVMDWQIGNLVIMQDPNGNIKPNRDRSTGPIDGPICLIMAIGLAMRNESKAFVFTGF